MALWWPLVTGLPTGLVPGPASGAPGPYLAAPSQAGPRGPGGCGPGLLPRAERAHAVLAAGVYPGQRPGEPEPASCSGLCRAARSCLWPSLRGRPRNPGLGPALPRPHSAGGASPQLVYPTTATTGNSRLARCLRRSCLFLRSLSRALRSFTSFSLRRRCRSCRKDSPAESEGGRVRRRREGREGANCACAFSEGPAHPLLQRPGASTELFHTGPRPAPFTPGGTS